MRRTQPRPRSFSQGRGRGCLADQGVLCAGLALRPLAEAHARTREERGVLAHVEARLGVALGVHDALQAVQAVGLEREHPLVVGEAEGRQGRALDVRVLRKTVTAVFGHDAGALFRGLQIPVVGAHEGVDHRPVAGRDAAEASGNVALVELGGGV